MFSGVIREIALVKDFKNNILTLQSKHKPNIGDSIAVNGTCLTVIKNTQDGFALELSQNTKNLIALENYTKSVHIEPAITIQDRLDGHILQGHIDGVGKILGIKKIANQVEFTIQAPKSILLLCIPKGSIAIDGISLTISEVYQDSFQVTIIPHTYQNTLFHSYQINRRVNIETDILVRSVYHLLQKQQNKTNSWSDFDFQVLKY
ncbi:MULTISPECIES: riboflavin synthase [unclassified Helicobacter]|uniref:riboflavin synthase n=1 Tax=unclassified Helicobacter TaxID=2593540 RepID=UPI000CF01C2F|nr:MULTISPECIES: riboflavin synthase [unclassified Helicobacter]